MGVRTDRSVVLEDPDGDSLTIAVAGADDEHDYVITISGNVFATTADLVALRHHLAELIDANERDAVSPAPSTDPWLVGPITDPQA